MVLRINDLNYNLPDVMRRIGYKPERNTPEGELAAVRLFGGDFPRFHIYAKSGGGILTLNLHLDQNRSSYAGTAAHGGDYDGDAVRMEMERIKNIIFEL